LTVKIEKDEIIYDNLENEYAKILSGQNPPNPLIKGDRNNFIDELKEAFKR
jgi:hypothetical protein